MEVRETSFGEPGLSIIGSSLKGIGKDGMAGTMKSKYNILKL